VRIELSITHQFESEQFAALCAAIKGERSGLPLKLLVHALEKIQNMSASLDRLVGEVTENRDVIASAVIALNTLAQEIRDLKNQPDVNAAIDALASQLDGQTNDLAAAIAANTQPALEPGAPAETTATETVTTDNSPVEEPPTA